MSRAGVANRWPDTATQTHTFTNRPNQTYPPPIPIDQPHHLTHHLPTKTNPTKQYIGAYYLEASGPESGKALLSAAVADDQRFAFSQAFQALGTFGL